MNNKIYRVIDANVNRSKEGLRVCEEITRFILNSSVLTNHLKSARHFITRAMKATCPGNKHLSYWRDSENDCCRNSSVTSEMHRESAEDIFIANMQRVKESLRVLEEFFKLFDKKTSRKFTLLRFRIYDIEKRTLNRIK